MIGSQGSSQGVLSQGTYSQNTQKFQSVVLDSDDENVTSTQAYRSAEMAIEGMTEDVS